MILANLLIGAPSWVVPAISFVVVLTILTWLSYRGAYMPLALKALAIALKTIGVFLLAACLMEPLFSGVRPRPGANLFVVLTDNSQSMTVQSGSRIRDTSLKQLLHTESSWRTRLEQDFDVRDYMFDVQLKHVGEPTEILLNGPASGLHSALATIATRFQERPVAGVLLLADGNATDESELESFDFPVYPVVDKDSAEIKDVRIRQMNVTESNFEGSPITLNANIACTGFDSQEIEARIVDQQGAVLAIKSATAKPGSDLDFRFSFKPREAGLSFHRLQVYPAKAKSSFDADDSGNEVTLANNSRWFAVDRGGGPFRVLYVSGRPNWEFKFLRRALDEDDEIKLTGLLRIAKKQPKFVFGDRSGVGERNPLFEGFDGKDDEDAEDRDQTVFLRLGVETPEELRDGFPKDAEDLFRFHAVILDDLEAKFFTPDQMLLLRRFVNQRGGGLLMLGGQECFVGGNYDKTPLGEVLPVYLSRVGEGGDGPFQWDLTREGWLQDWTRLRANETAERSRLAELPGFLTMNRVPGLKPGASVLAQVSEGGERDIPALVIQRFGKGRSAALLVGDLWRWAMHEKQPAAQDVQQLWRQVVRWLVSDVPQRVRIQSQRSRGAIGPTTLEVTVRDEEFKAHDNAETSVTVTTPTGEQIDLTAESSDEAGEYSVDFWPHDAGPYRATTTVVSASGEQLDRKQTGWTSEPAADEFRELDTNREVLQRLADQSGGELVDVDDLDAFVSGLPNRKVPITETWVYPIWHQPWLLALAIGCLCGEWGIRRWRGLP